jgi:hypothetical protein
LSRSTFSAGRSRRDHPSTQDLGELQRKDCNTPGTLGQDGISCGDPAMACQCYPGGHCGAEQGGGFLEGQVAWQRYNRFFIEERIFGQHSVEIGADPVGQVVWLDRSAKPAGMKATSNPIANFDPSNSFADRCDLAGVVAQRHYADLRWTTTTTFEDHQIAVVERARADPHEDLLQPGPRILARPQHDSVNAAEAVDAIGFHLPLPGCFRSGRAQANNLPPCP